MRGSGLPAVAGVLLLGAVLSGCTSAVTGTASREPVPSAPGSPAAPTTPAPPDAARAQAALLQPADLPAGWTASSTGAQDDSMPAFAACLGARDTSSDRIALGDSPGFSDARGDAIHSEVAVYRSQRDVDDDTALLGDPRAADCFAQALKADLAAVPTPAGTSIGAPRCTVTPGSGGGPGNVVATASGSVPVTDVSGRHLTAYFEYVFVTGRMTKVHLGFLGIGALPPAALRAALVTTVAQRVAAL